METIRASGARVVLTAVGGSLSTHVYSAAVRAGIACSHGVQWLGTSEALQGFSVFDVPNATSHFAGILFLAPAYGIDLGAIAYQSIESGPMLLTAQGGLDPLVARATTADLTSLSPWALQQLRLVQDVQQCTGYAMMLFISWGMTFSAASYRGLLMYTQLPGVSIVILTGGQAKFDDNNDRRGFIGMWVQLRRSGVFVVI